jgi:hypothetical protein
MRATPNSSLFRREVVFKRKLFHAGVVVGSIVECEIPKFVGVVDLPKCERISDLIGKRCTIVSTRERSKPKKYSVLNKVAVDKLGVDPQE